MKITIVAHKLARGDGQGRINYEIARHALAQGHGVTLLATTVEPDLVSAGAKLVPIVSPLRKPDLANVMYFARRADQHLKTLGSQSDVIVGNGFTLRYPHHVNLCQFVHGAWIHSPVHTAKLTRGPYAWYQWLYTKANARWEQDSFANARFVVPPSRMVHGELRSIGVPEEKIRVIYNGVDLDEFRPGHEDRKSLGLPEARPLALFVGDIRTPRKNLDTVLRALVQVPDMHLAVVGRLAGSPFPAMAKSLGVDPRVHFLDFRRDTGRIMRAVDLFVFPTRYDTFGLVILEAMASGVPTITTTSAGASELMTPQCGVVLQNTDDVDALAAAMRKLTADEQVRREASAAARAAAEQCSWTNMARQYLQLCEEARASHR